MDPIHSTRSSDHGLVPFDIIDERLGEDLDTEQHKARRGNKMKKRSIRQYGHATGRWGAALESFGPMWVSPLAAIILGSR